MAGGHSGQLELVALESNLFSLPVKSYALSSPSPSGLVHQRERKDEPHLPLKTGGPTPRAALAPAPKGLLCLSSLPAPEWPPQLLPICAAAAALRAGSPKGAEG